MNIDLSTNQEILLILSKKIPIYDICYQIINLKDKIEKQDALNYHIETYEKISSKYYQSMKFMKDEEGYKSYVINDKYFIANKDKNLDFYNETGISCQVRSLLLDILNCPSPEYFSPNDHSLKYINYINDTILNKTLYEWREHDDKLYNILSKKIMDLF